MSQTKVAKTYAKSLLDLSIEKGVLEQVKNDMEVIYTTCIDSKELRLMLLSPIVSSDKKLAVLSDIFKNNVSELSFLFIELLAKKGREANLTAVSNAFSSLYLEYKNILKAVIVSVDGVGDSLKQKIKELVKESYQKEVIFDEVKDPSLLGGFIITIGDKQIDASVSKKLAQLKNSFSENAYISHI